jgi:acetoin utilization protein AcuB
MNFDVTAIMTKNPSWISCNASIKESIDLLNATNLSHLLILDDKKLIGVISKNDLLEKFYEITNASSGKTYSTMVLNHTKVKSLIKNTPITINDSSSCHNAMELMIKNKVHSIPVLNDEKEAIGIITPTDIMYALYRDNI